MQVMIVERLETRPIPRSTKAPWLEPSANKIELTKDFVFRVQDPKTGVDEVVVVPKGYRSDWSSIPRLLWFVYPPNYSEAREGAIAHDYLYSHLHWYYKKKFADRLLRAFMRRCGASKTAQQAFYWAVRLGGKGGWKYRARDDAHPHWRKRYAKIPYPSGESISSETAIKTQIA